MERSEITAVDVSCTNDTLSLVLAIARELRLPIRYVGVGEQKDDLLPFDSREFIDSLFQ